MTGRICELERRDGERQEGRAHHVGDKHLTPEDLADREGIPLQTVYTWNSRAAGPRFMKIGRHVRYRLADVIEWEDARLTGDPDGGAAA
jgi:predicted DNA-binding transcriptional regulator AlpA